MEITKSQNRDVLELRLRGRLDAYWADHVGKTINDAIHAGSHKIELNLAQVDYLSSAGLRLLLQYYKQLKAVQGSLSITEPSAAVFSILKMAGFTMMISAAAAAPTATPSSAKTEPRSVEKKGTIFQVFDQSLEAELRCSLIGCPE